MRKAVKILLVLLALAGCFLLGWRVMPKVWPTIKTNVVYRVLPALEPTPAPTQEPYQPNSNAALTDEIAASDSVIYYFYKPQCPYCRAIEPLMGGLPDTITLPDGTASNVKLIAVDKLSEEGAALIEAYYEANNIPDEKRYVPAVVIGDKYFMPGQEITDGLLKALTAGEGVATKLLDGAERK